MTVYDVVKPVERLQNELTQATGVYRAVRRIVLEPAVWQRLLDDIIANTQLFTATEYGACRDAEEFELNGVIYEKGKA